MPALLVPCELAVVSGFFLFFSHFNLLFLSVYTKTIKKSNKMRFLRKIVLNFYNIYKKIHLTSGFSSLERAARIELVSQAWEARILPMNYARTAKPALLLVFATLCQKASPFRLVLPSFAPNEALCFLSCSDKNKFCVQFFRYS